MPQGAASAVANGDGWVFRLDGLDEVEPILATVRQAGGVIADLRLEQTDLEDVFVRVMQGKRLEGTGKPAEVQS